MIMHSRDINYAAGGSQKNDSLTMEVLLDPRVHAAQLDTPRITVAEDEHGLSLVSRRGSAPNQFFQGGNQQQWMTNFSVPLVFPPHYGATLARLEGTVEAHLPNQEDQLQVPDLVKSVGASAAAANRKVRVLACSFDGKNTITLHVHLTRAPMSDGHPLGTLLWEFGTARIIDSAGQPLVPDGHGLGTDSDVDWQGSFSTINKAAKPPFILRWPVTTIMEPVTIPFKFKDLPLPPS
jgi:hypothetical protein